MRRGEAGGPERHLGKPCKTRCYERVREGQDDGAVTVRAAQSLSHRQALVYTGLNDTQKLLLLDRLLSDP